MFVLSLTHTLSLFLNKQNLKKERDEVTWGTDAAGELFQGQSPWACQHLEVGWSVEKAAKLIASC